MGRINVLDTATANAIKAGEVIERPVSVVKELVDNSIDAGASSVKIEFEGGGISLIRVSDNGIGMDREDAQKAFIIHATSKIRKIEDIYDLSTQGFRGEALASVAACATVELLTKQADSDIGTMVRFENGSMALVKDAGADNGTVVTVTGLFESIPARYKFLKKDSTEGMYICSLCEKLAIVNPHISFKLIKDGKPVFTTPGNGSMQDTIYCLYGKEVASALIPVDYEYEGLKLRGFSGKPSFYRGNRGMQYIYVNERCIKNASVSAAIDEAYRNSLMKNKYPVCFLCIYVPPHLVDVNVHPQKAEVKFHNESDVFRLVYHGIKEAVFESGEAKDAADLVRETEEQKREGSVASGKQLSYKFSTPVSRATDSFTAPSLSAASAPVGVSDAKAANDLLEALSKFRPDIAEISGTTSEEKTVVPDTSDEAVFPDVTDVPGDQKDTVKGSDDHSEDVVIEAEDTYVSDIDELLRSEFKGIIFDTYIIMESRENVFYVDQHAAHERVLYEKFLKKHKVFDSEKKDVQTMLVPALVDLGSADYSFVSDNLEAFAESGFDIELMGQRQIALRSMPVSDSARARLKSMDEPSVIFRHVLEDMKRDVPAKNSVWYSLIQTTACKAAVKAHDKLTREEALELISMLRGLDDPYHCAHGRPTFIKVALTDFEKRFKRIV
ncbi:MAG: DNA mismatch repair endonuclease MutL [Clostridiales bacterium]|nr:DNA mismatch repair endonuclease MutL [Clostridiales bacterium]